MSSRIVSVLSRGSHSYVESLPAISTACGVVGSLCGAGIAGNSMRDTPYVNTPVDKGMYIVGGSCIGFVAGFLTPIALPILAAPISVGCLTYKLGDKYD